MSMDSLVHYLDSYGYMIIFIFLFFGIVGIPAPEESLLFLIGILSEQQDVKLFPAVLSAFAGSFTGMLAAYLIGKHLGKYVQQYVKWIGLTDERWERVKTNYMKNMQKTIVLGFYVPGIRQINPYFAGMKSVPQQVFVRAAFFGTALWILPFILTGYYAGNALHIKPEVVPYFGLVLLAIFIMVLLVKQLRKH